MAMEDFSVSVLQNIIMLQTGKYFLVILDVRGSIHFQPFTVDSR